MNHIQKIWLRVLSPVAYVINEKLAKRSGLLGRIGKFWMIGPREYGSHPMNKLFIFLNRRWLFATAVALHRYSVIKTLTHGGYHMLRPFKHVSILGPMAVFFGMFTWIYTTSEVRGYEPDRLTYVARRMGGKTGLPLGALNQRTSAHYLEINYLYQAEMLKRYQRVKVGIIEDRKKANDYEKRTRYADPSYEYVPMPAVALQDYLS